MTSEEKWKVVMMMLKMEVNHNDLRGESEMQLWRYDESEEGYYDVK